LLPLLFPSCPGYRNVPVSHFVLEYPQHSPGFNEDRVMTTAENTSSVKSPFYFDINRIRRNFPIFAKPINGKPLIYLDNAATTQKPQAVINAIVGFYTQECASVHRGVYYLSERATESFENSREKVRRFINAASPREIVFVRGTTEGVNLIA